jgi:PPOX class probable F420-dependent enzyme
MLTEAQQRFLCAQRVARFASADAAGVPHVVPVCFVYRDGSACFSIDEKPKRDSTRALKRVRNVQANPAAVLMVDRYDEDWSQLGWLMLRGSAQVLHTGEEHAAVQAALKRRYPQLRGMRLHDKPVVALRVRSVNAWGNLDIDPLP